MEILKNKTISFKLIVELWTNFYHNIAKGGYMKKKILCILIAFMLIFSFGNVNVSWAEDGGKAWKEYTVEACKKSTSSDAGKILDALRLAIWDSEQEVNDWKDRVEAFQSSEGFRWLDVTLTAQLVEEKMNEANTWLEEHSDNGQDGDKENSTSWQDIPDDKIKECSAEEAEKYYKLLNDPNPSIKDMGKDAAQNYIIKIGKLLESAGFINFEGDKTVYRNNLVSKMQYAMNTYEGIDDEEALKYIDNNNAETIGANLSPDEEPAEHAEAMQGGKLLTPIVDLLLTLGDALMWLIQKAIVGTSGQITLDIGLKILSVILGVLAAIAVVVLIVATAGTFGAAIAAIGGACGSILTAIGSSGVVSMLLTVGTIGAGLAAYNFVADGFSAAFLPDVTVIPTYSVSPEEIFEGKLLIFDINFFNPKQVYVKLEGESEGKPIQDYNENDKDNINKKVEYYYYLDENDKEVRTSKQNSALALSTIISKWYYVIRNMALVIMMSILLYIGIRMMLCSIASEKSKYKKMLVDWVVSMCLVFVLHYIMVFAVSINESLVDMMEASTEKNQGTVVLKLDSSRKSKSFVDAIEDNNNPEIKQALCDKDKKPLYDENGNSTGAGEAAMFIWPTNLVGRMRILCQMQNGTAEYVGYAIAYIILVLYTVFFTFTYLKRVLYLAFLTVIAPLVAMTYSIDKISDGKAQAFNIWLKEYIFNLLIQPVHLLLYLLLISMAFDLAGTNIVYTLVAIGFMIPAEKLIRSMFGFEKAKTPGFLGGAAGAALAMSGIQKLSHLAGHGPKGGNKPAGKLDKSDDDPKGLYSRSADSGKGFDELFADENNGDPSDDSGGPLSKGAGKSPQYSINDGNGGNKPPLPSYEDIDLAEQNANPMDFLNDDEKKEYSKLKYMSADRMDMSDHFRKNELENRANRQKEIHFQQERSKRRMLEEAKRAQQEFEESSRRAREASKQAQAKSQSRMATFGRMTSKGFKNAISKENLGNAVATTIKGGTKLTGLALGGAVGAATGIASGDMSKVLQNAALGATAGGSLGSAAGNGIVGGVTSGVDRYKDAKTEYEKERYGEDYSAHLKAELDNKFMKDKEARKFYERECSSELAGFTGKAREEELNKIMRQAIEYRQYGVTDNALIVKARNLDKSNRTSSYSKAAAMMASKAKDIKGIESYQKQLAKQIGNEKAGKIAKDAAKIGGIYS